MKDLEEDWSPQWTYIHKRKPFYIHKRKPFNGHFPCKKEAKTLRKIMSQTGLSEEKVRSVKKYRVELADSARNFKKSECTKAKKHFKKRVTGISGLPFEHSKSLEIAKDLFDNYLRMYSHIKYCIFCSLDFKSQWRKTNEKG